jgi:hypothetical protein
MTPDALYHCAERGAVIQYVLISLPNTEQTGAPHDPPEFDAASWDITLRPNTTWDRPWGGPSCITHLKPLILRELTAQPQ